MEANDRSEVRLAERVAVQGEKGRIEPVRGIRDTATRPERLLLDAVVEPEPSILVAEALADLRGHVTARDDRARDAVTAQVLEGVGEQRPVDEREHVLASSLGEGPQTRALPSDEDDRG